jgi:hypothetical protein
MHSYLTPTYQFFRHEIHFATGFPQKSSVYFPTWGRLFIRKIPAAPFFLSGAFQLLRLFKPNPH